MGPGAWRGFPEHFFFRIHAVFFGYVSFLVEKSVPVRNALAVKDRFLSGVNFPGKNTSARQATCPTTQAGAARPLGPPPVGPSGPKGPKKAPWGHGALGAPWAHVGPLGRYVGPLWGPLGPHGPPLRCGSARSAITLVCTCAAQLLISPYALARHSF